jgi:competence protein ComEA
MAGRTWLGLLAGLLSLGLGAPARAAPDVNQASLAELESLPGIGPGTSGRILEERQKGLFKDWADLTRRVKGVGAGNAAKLSAAGLTVNGVSYPVPVQAAASPSPSASK